MRLGFGDRMRTMRALFGGILPDRVLARSDKAVFNGVFWASTTQRLLESWYRDFPDPALQSLVDPAAFRMAMSGQLQDARTSQLVQALGL